MDDRTPAASTDAVIAAGLRDVITRGTSGPGGTSSQPVGDDSTSIDARVRSLRAPVGPADTTAFYDFRHVELAFESVWTEVYDAEFTNSVAKLYTTVGRVREYTGHDPKDPELVTWVEDLDATLDEISAEAEEGDLIGDDSYEVVLSVFPSMSPDLWSWIGPTQRNRFFSFALQYLTARDGSTSASGNDLFTTLAEGIVGAVEDTTDFVNDAADFVMDTLSDIGDALTFWN
jgi:hypothetical protein